MWDHTPSPAAPDPVAALLGARLSGHALTAFPAPVPTTLAEAYGMQQRLIAALGAPVLGWKVGRIPPALIETLGAERVAGPVLRIAELDGDVPGAAAIFAVAGFVCVIFTYIGVNTLLPGVHSYA